MSQYTAQSLEVLSGLDPVRRRPGMYTDTSRPNHLAQEVIDNAVDEALAGHADEISVTVHKDGSLSVQDNGRGCQAGDARADDGDLHGRPPSAGAGKKMVAKRPETKKRGREEKRLRTSAGTRRAERLRNTKRAGCFMHPCAS